VNQFHGAHLFLRKAGRRPEVVGLNVLLSIPWPGRIAGLVHHFSQVDPVNTVFMIELDSAGQQSVNFGLS
jgi:hypothetical protein